MYKHPQPLYNSFHPHRKNSRSKHLHHNNHKIQPYGSFSPGKSAVFCLGSYFFQRSAATGMVDRICQGEDDAALDRKQQAAEVVGDRWDGMGMGDDEGMSGGNLMPMIFL